MVERRKRMGVEHLLGWVGLFLVGAIGAAYRIRDWVLGGSGIKISSRMAAPPDGTSWRRTSPSSSIASSSIRPADNYTAAARRSH